LAVIDLNFAGGEQVRGAAQRIIPVEADVAQAIPFAAA